MSEEQFFPQYLIDEINKTPRAGKSDLAIEERRGKQDVVPTTALKLDEWSLSKGRDLVEQSELIRAVYKDESVADLPDDMDSAERKRRKREKSESISSAVADMFSAAFELEPQMNEKSQDETRHEFMRQLLDTPEYHALHSQTVLDAESSELACAAFSKELCEMKKAIAQVNAKPGSKSDKEFENELVAVRAVSNALQNAGCDVNDLNDARQALGFGLGGGGRGKMDGSALSQTFKRVRGSRMLQRICELAGRYRRLAQAKQRKKTKHGRDDVVGVVLDGDVGRLVGSEIAALTNPDTELDALRRVIERQAMCRDYRGTEKVAKGPIMIFLDESGSMGGEPSYTSKAIALALAWVARKQRRWICLVAFAGSADPSALRVLAMPPGKVPEGELIEWLMAFDGGGTTLEWLNGETMDILFHETGADYGKTDVVIITDGACHFPDDVKKSCLQWKALRKVKLMSLILGGDDRVLREVSDRVYNISNLDVDQDAVGDILSV